MKNHDVFSWLELAAPELDEADMKYLGRFANELETSIERHATRGPDLLQIKKELGRSGFGAADVAPWRGGSGRRAVVQGAMQFLCGWHDPETRDAAGVAHGRMVLEHGSAAARRVYQERICGGELVAIGASEERGGTDIKRFETMALPAGDGKWLLNGTKCHVSRIHEASILVVFFKTPEGGMSAAVLDAGTPGIRRETMQPSGLTGWSWGRVFFEDVELRREDFLGAGPGDGMRIFHDHFTYFRPMVAAVALGALARIYDEAVADLSRRLQEGLIDHAFDSTRQLLGRAHHAIESELNYTLRVIAAGKPGDPRALTVKACAVDRAVEIGEELERILGARGFRAESVAAKAMAAIRAFRFADGVSDRLLHAAGGAFLKAGRASVGQGAM